MNTQITNEFSGRIGFIGGGNMASALIGGLIRQGTSAAQITVVEPFASTQQALKTQFSIDASPVPSSELSSCDLVVWAVKPQVFRDAALPVGAFTQHALHLSVAAGIPSDSMARWLSTDRIVRAMPNTPALVGKGITGLFARPSVSADDRSLVEKVLGPTGDLVWVETESDIDSVTALSGSGPAYVFYFLEAMEKAGQDLGLSAAQSRKLAIETFSGAAALAKASPDALSVLRERVTSKGGTTYAALMSMESAGISASFIEAMKAASARAKELGEEFGRG